MTTQSEQIEAGSIPEGLRSFNGLPEEMDKWAVWTKRGKRPTYFHDTREGAETEAARLAGKQPGSKFIVIHLVSKFGTTPPEPQP